MGNDRNTQLSVFSIFSSTTRRKGALKMSVKPKVFQEPLIYFPASTTFPWFPVLHLKHRLRLDPVPIWSADISRQMTWCVWQTSPWTGNRTDPLSSTWVWLVKDGMTERGEKEEEEIQTPRQRSGQIINHLIVTRKERVPLLQHRCFSTAPPATGS